MKITITPFWDARVMKGKESRILLTINLNRQQFRVSLRLRSTKEDFMKAIGGRSLNQSQKQLRSSIFHYVEKAELILSRLPNPTKDAFIRLFKSEADLVSNNKTDASVLFTAKYSDLMKERRFGSAQNCKAALNSLKRFSKDLFLEDIDERFLKGYVMYMLNEGHSSTTAQIYLRNLRTIFKAAIKDGLISEKYYPLKNFPIGSSIKSKAVLNPEHLKALWEYECKGIREGRAKAFFFFCYLSNGINFKDLPHLRLKNIKGDSLVFVRQKTKRTAKLVKEIKVHLHEEMKRIIDEWGNPSKKPENYIFPLLKMYKSELHMDQTINRYKRVCNAALKRIEEKLGFKVKLCLILPRHSFATVLNESGTPITFISDALGRSTITTTQHYIKSLPDRKMAEISGKLLQFNNAV